MQFPFTLTFLGGTLVEPLAPVVCVLAAIGLALLVYGFGSGIHEARNDRNFIVEAISQSLFALRYAKGTFRNDLEIMQAAAAD